LFYIGVDKLGQATFTYRVQKEMAYRIGH